MSRLFHFIFLLLAASAFGNVPAYLDSTNSGPVFLNWSQARMSGHGPLPGYTLQPVLTSSARLTSASVFQGQRTDPTEFLMNCARQPKHPSCQ
jgi:hypothetical protein